MRNQISKYIVPRIAGSKLETSNLWIYWFILAILIQLVGLRLPIHHDEGVFLTIASRIVHGELPYRDYFDHKPPGIYYLFSWGISWWGTNMLWVRWLNLGVNLLSSLLVGFAATRVTAHVNGWIATTLYLLLLPFYHGQYALTEPFLNFFSLLSLVVLLGSSKEIRMQGFIAGLLLGTAGLFKQSVVVLIPVWLLWSWYQKRSGLFLILLLAGVLLPYFVTLSFYLLEDALVSAWKDIFWFNMVDYGMVGLQGIEDSWDLVFPLSLFWVGLLIAAWKKCQTRVIESKEWLLIACTMTALPGIIFIRPYHHYWLQLLPFVSILIGIWWKDLKNYRWGIGTNLIVVNIVLVIYGLGWLWPEYNKQIAQISPITCENLQPYEYYLTSCKPKKYFFKVDFK